MGSFIAPSSKRSLIVDADPNHPRRTYPQFTNILQPVSTVERESPVNKLNRVVTSGLLYPLYVFLPQILLPSESINMRRA